MALLPRPVIALLLLVLTGELRCQEQDQPTDWRATLKTIRNGVHKIDTYLNAALDLLGGEDGLCQYKCSDGSKPFPRYGYKPSPPNGCGSPLFGVHVNMIFLFDKLFDCVLCVKKAMLCSCPTVMALSYFAACETTVELLFDSVIHLGCKPYLDSQRAACRCRYEEKTDL
ncbi:PREDICTED: group XIIA secretory phospholipase A2 [Hipposideros armiger]|uniref:Group XIIA secretory phospholipase A2 n=1 Tax=Hipposideros armiger TaxID=186990 RepID=A0A8B7QSA3_HIPAR|nr:PREDICTED: group XIIA secretory phospholipase A2 [Hipposideros armiger]